MTKANRVFHSLFALAVLFQITSAQWMHSRNKPNITYPDWMLWLFQCHIYIGIFTGVILISYLTYNISRYKNNKLKHLFPTSKCALRLIASDFICLLKFKFPPNHQLGGIKGFVQGLGVLLILSIATTGFLWFTIYSITGSLNNPILYAIKEVHEYLANIIWFYLGGHVGMFILHLFFNKRVNEEFKYNATIER